MAQGSDKIPSETFEEILKKVQEEEKDAGWQHAKTFEHTEVYRKSSTDSSVHIFKCISQLVGVPYNDAVKLVTDIQLRSRYDTTFTEIKVLEDCGHYSTIYWYCPFPTPASDRDLILHSWFKQDEATKTTWLVSINGNHANAPAKSKVVRAESKLSGVIIRQDEKDPNSSVLTTVSQTDMKGMIPGFIVNGAFVKSSDNWREALVNFYHNTYSKEQ